MANTTLTIGQVAAKAGVNASAIRYYERHGLMPEPERVSGQRRYTDAAIRRLGIIDAAKRAGFSLDEVRVLLESTDQGAPANQQLQALAARKLPEVDALIARTEAMRRWLTAATACGCETIDACSLFSYPSQAASASEVCE